MDTMNGYHDLYLLSDVLLLADVLVAFRKLCLTQYDIDPWHFATLPGEYTLHIQLDNISIT